MQTQSPQTRRPRRPTAREPRAPMRAAAGGLSADRCVEGGRLLEPDERYHWVPPLGGVLCERCPGAPHDRTSLSLEALKLLKAFGRMMSRRSRACGSHWTSNARSSAPCATSWPTHSNASRSRWPSSTRFAPRVSGPAAPAGVSPTSRRACGSRARSSGPLGLSPPGRRRAVLAGLRTPSRGRACPHAGEADGAPQ